jgi:hypothetical protein
VGQLDAWARTGVVRPSQTHGEHLYSLTDLRKLRVATARLLGELEATDLVQAQRLEGPLRELADLPVWSRGDTAR